jgi:hypothetical protein
VSGLALWTLGHYVFKTGVPDVVASWIYVLVPSVLTFGAGYAAKHTPRPAVPPAPVPSNVTVTPAGVTFAAAQLPPAPPEKTLLPPAAPE